MRWIPGSTSARACRSARCSVSCAARLADGRAQPPGSVSNCATPRSQPGCVAGWRHINSGMPTRSRCRARVYRWWSYSGNWACRPRGHVRVLARHRQHRDRARRPRTPRADDPRGQRASGHALSRPSQGAVSLGAAHRPAAAGCAPRTRPHRPAPPRALPSKEVVKPTPPLTSAIASRWRRASGAGGVNRRSDRQRRSARAPPSVAKRSSGRGACDNSSWAKATVSSPVTQSALVPRSQPPRDR
jgi:hypothetical protein